MSRVGQAIIKIPDGTEVRCEGNNFWAKGSNGELVATISNTVNILIKEKIISVEPKTNNARSKALWGTARALINNAVTAFVGVEGSSGNRFLGSATNNAFFGTTGADGLELATNNNVRMIIDSSGRVTTPAQPAFHAYGTGSSWVIFSNGSWTKLVLDATPPLNIGSHYDSTNSKFIAPVAGVYHFYYKVYGRVQSVAAANTYWQSRFQKNNNAITGYSTMLMGYLYNGSADETATYSMTISLAATDEITVHAQATATQNGEYYPAACEFGGYLVG